MSNQNLTYRDLLEIVELIKSSSHFREFHLKVGELEVDLKRVADGSAVPAPCPAPAPAAAPPPARPAESSPQRHGHVGGGEILIESAAAEPARSPRSAPLAIPEHAVQIKSPMVGTFYRAPEPGAHPFVEVGDKVNPDTVVCIIEVMKLMNSIQAGRGGVVTHILVENAEAVEYGQTLMVIEPEA
ncbi:MAG: acetyl-CoA carboxylase biotin carboxyl carrier protein [Pseudomonadota bacterium]